MKSAKTLIGGILLSGGLACLLVSQARAGDESKFAYAGSKSCKKCHSANFKSWEATAHGKAMETLKPGQATEAKAKHNLDPTKDYSTDASCLKCHATGSGTESGYAVPDPEDKKAVRKASKLAGVGCESCHGPGKEYGKVFKEIMTSKRMYKVEELTAVGLTEVSETTCTGCHNSGSPTHNPDEKFDFEKMKEKGVHDHVELKQREG